MSSPSSIHGVEVAPRRQPPVEQERGRRAVELVQRLAPLHDRARRAQGGDRARRARDERAGVGVAERAVDLVAVDQVAPLDASPSSPTGGARRGRGARVVVAAQHGDARGEGGGGEHAAADRDPPPHGLLSAVAGRLREQVAARLLRPP